MTPARFLSTKAGVVTVRRVDVTRHPGGDVASDLVAAEEPLEVRLDGEPFAVIMRTPGRDRDLAVGFLFAEGVVRDAGMIARVDVLRASGVADVVFADEHAGRVRAALAERRLVSTTSSCGACGRRSLAALGTVPNTGRASDWVIDPAVVAQLPTRLSEAQPTFARTGGLHAAALFDRQGTMLASAEDVGRHNAVDKLVGEALTRGRLPLATYVLMVSGRTSFEIVQKAALAGLPMVAAVSAPSSLAVDCAREAGLTLLGFVRDGRFNVYTHSGRVAGANRAAQ